MGEADFLLSPHFAAADLLHAGETWVASRIPNIPAQPATWSALRQLCREILEPARANFGHPVITYGFASEALTRLIPGRIYPSLDQHAGHEVKQNGEPICKRLGQAADFYIPGVPSTELACWIADELPFDRMYFYGDTRPVHVSVGPENSRSITAMLPSPSGRRIPRRVTSGWLRERKGKL
jgi:hypothetical protein